MSLDLSWVGSRREGKASFIPVWSLERTVLRTPNRPKNQPGHPVVSPSARGPPGTTASGHRRPRGLHSLRGPGRVREGLFGWPPWWWACWRLPQDPVLPAAASRGRRCRARLFANLLLPHDLWADPVSRRQGDKGRGFIRPSPRALALRTEETLPPDCSPRNAL